ncbi:MAG TPA: histidine kinase [Prolixibacteraceae bacterium]
MKRIILLLLVLTSFQISYSEELNADQQQLAWKFIYENLLSKDYLPNTFKQDIIINLKGDITVEDSLFVKNLIVHLQKAIPTLKIELSDIPGNLILGLNDGKRNTANINMFKAHEIQSVGLYFPVPKNISKYERTQYIYSQLFQGLTFLNGQEKKQHIAELKGCVYNELDFKSITFSPFDFFILEKLYAPDFSFQLAMNLPPELQKSSWSLIGNKFLGKTKEPIIYRDDIAIQLDGKVSAVDSVIMNELIDQFKMIIPNRKIYLTSKKANLIINFIESNSKFVFTSTRLGNSIQSQNIEIVIPQNISKEERNKTLYFRLARSLVDFSTSKSNSLEIEGCVFEENEPKSITYTPIDAFILNKVYADDFHQQFKNQFIQQSSYRLYLIHMYHKELDFIFFLLGLLIPVILLTRLILKGSFKAHNWSWKEFNKQGLYLIGIGSIFLICLSLSDLQFILKDLKELLSAILSAFVSINLIYLLEKLILKNRNLGGAKILIIYFTTLLGMLFSIRYKVSASQLDELNQRTLNDYFFLITILIVPLARSLYIFLNDRYKSIINQKDVELAQMGELHKQAELQSLRAKINPHFLYNALNSIASLATTDGRKTEQMALSLSDFFKYAINREQKQLNTLAEELNATRTYLEIEKVRFGDRLSFEINCPDELLDIQIPQLLIQPLVENAIKHGLSQITQNGLIRIVVSKSGSQLKIRVYDNGPAFPDGPLTGFGIQNTQERIALLYGAKATINWQNGEEKMIEICLPIVN